MCFGHMTCPSESAAKLHPISLQTVTPVCSAYRRSHIVQRDPAVRSNIVVCPSALCGLCRSPDDLSVRLPCLRHAQSRLPSTRGRLFVRDTTRLASTTRDCAAARGVDRGEHGSGGFFLSVLRGRSRWQLLNYLLCLRRTAAQTHYGPDTRPLPPIVSSHRICCLRFLAIPSGSVASVRRSFARVHCCSCGQLLRIQNALTWALGEKNLNIWKRNGWGRGQRHYN